MLLPDDFLFQVFSINEKSSRCLSWLLLRVVPLHYMNRQRSQKKVFSLKSWRQTQQSMVLCSRKVSAGNAVQEKCSISFKD